MLNYFSNVPLGVFYTIIASNASSMVVYGVGRYFGGGVLHSLVANKLIQRYAERMRRNSFETSLLMRFLFLLYDLVSYLAGFLHIGWRGFLLATILGSIPGTISFILLGASMMSNIVDVDTEITLDPATLAVGFALMAISLIVSRLLRTRESRGEQQVQARK